MLTYFERKARLPFGASSGVAQKYGVAPSTITAIMKGINRNRELEKALAALMRPRTTVTEAFGEPGPERLARAVGATTASGEG
jgi:hypothetical protein